MGCVTTDRPSATYCSKETPHQNFCVSAPLELALRLQQCCDTHATEQEAEDSYCDRALSYWRVHLWLASHLVCFVVLICNGITSGTAAKVVIIYRPFCAFLLRDGRLCAAHCGISHSGGSGLQSAG